MFECELYESPMCLGNVQELQRDMWEMKLKLQRAEDACTAAEEKTLCLESFVREGVSNVGRVMLCPSAHFVLFVANSVQLSKAPLADQARTLSVSTWSTPSLREEVCHL